MLTEERSALIKNAMLVIGLVMTVGLMFFFRWLVRQIRSENRPPKPLD
jgi:hypothetical protein